MRIKNEQNNRQRLYQNYVTAVIKAIAEMYGSAHGANNELPVYEDYEKVIKDSQNPKKEETAEDIKNRVFSALEKIGNSG